ncbi:MAG: GNAT family N-acetyltransferase [Clostridia bacterium]|nr:GNAT family N-acetyltransferase [Clostridia bacterium]
MKIYNIKEKLEFLEEVATLTQEEWGNKSYTKMQKEEKIKKKMEKIKNNLNNPNYCKLILVDNNTLVGFVSIFEHDSSEREDLTPWYATLYIKEKYRGMGLSKVLNDAIINEAQKRQFQKIYLKTYLVNFYEKYGFLYMETLNNGERLYVKNLK